MSQSILRLEQIEHRYPNGHKALNDFSLQVERGEIACLLGPSGCGKTTALRVIAGFEPLRSGEVFLDTQRVSSPSECLPPEKRNVGIVFQDAALFPHLTVAANVGFGLHRQSKNDRAKRVEELLTLVELNDHSQKYPHQLSGGQRQRIAIARALAPRPSLILLDEPFSNLDADLRQQLSSEIRRLLKMQGATAVLVTHDQYEAFAMADRVALLRDGVLQQFADPETLFNQPANRFVASFIGEGSFVPATCIKDGIVQCGLGELAAENTSISAGWRGDLLLRPEHIDVGTSNDQSGKIVSVAFRGNRSLYGVEFEGHSVLVYGAPGKHIGDQVHLKLGIDRGLVFESDS